MGWLGADFQRTHNFSADASAGINMLASRFDEEFDNFEVGLEQCLKLDGTNTPSNDFPLGGFKFTNVGAATSTNEYLRLDQFQQLTPILCSYGGTSDVMSISTFPVFNALVSGHTIIVSCPSVNTTTSVVIKLNGLSAVPVKNADGTALAIGDVKGLRQYIYNGTEFVLMNTKGARYSNTHIFDFGGIGNGIADDSNAVRDALLAGGSIYFPQGYTFYCPTLSQHTVSADIRLFGGGTLKGVTGTYLLKPAGGDIVLDGVTFDTWAGIVESDVADSGTTDLLHVCNNQFLNMSALTIDHEIPLNNAIIEGNIFTTVNGESVRIGKNDYALQDTWKKITIRNNRWNGVTSSGTNSAMGAIVYGKEVNITGNYVSNVDASSGTGEAHGFYTKARKSIISNNVIVSIVGASGAATKCGINVKGNVRADTGAPQGFNTIVANNYVESAGGYGIRAQTDECLVIGNVIEEPGDSAITVDAAGDNVQVIGNKGYTASGASKVGIRMSQNGSRAVISNNIMEGFSDTCLVAVGSAESLTAVMIQGNVFHADTSAGYGIRFSLATTSAVLTYPLIKNNTVSNGFIGIQMPSLGTTTGLVMEGNDLRGATTKLNGSLPSGTRAQFNLGYVSEAYGVTGAIATGATVTHGITGTPAVVHITALDASTTDIYVTAIGATTFAVNYGGGGTHVFAWTARLAATYA